MSPIEHFARLTDIYSNASPQSYYHFLGVVTMETRNCNN